MKRRGVYGVLLAVSALLAGIFCLPRPVFAQAANPATGEFSLQVSPSPLVATLKPGTATQLEFTIRNTGTGTEDLKIAPRSFIVSNDTGQVALNDDTPPDYASWISFSHPTFTITPGGQFVEDVNITLPKNTGFSYSFALVVSRANTATSQPGQRLIKGSLATFTLLNVDQPGAVRKLVIPRFTTTQGIYEYLPATLSVQFKNTGNTIAQPFGNIFIQRSASAATPISTLPVNPAKGYILPGSSRLLQTDWNDGFPAYKTITASDGSQKKTLVWDWSKLGKLRIGHYTARLVAVYNDGARDVPIQQDVSFWVIPWKILGGLLVVLLILGYGVWSVVRKAHRLVRTVKHRR